MNMPRHIKVKPNQVAIRAWVVRQTNVALGTDFDMSADQGPCGVEDDDQR